MSRYITKYMNLEKSKRPTFWKGGSTEQGAYEKTTHNEGEREGGIHSHCREHILQNMIASK